jgi:hypothetical protein
MGILEDFAGLIEATEVMQQVFKSLREEPAQLLGQICAEYRGNSLPVPDHRLSFVGYLGEATLKALIAAGLIRRLSGERLSLYAYEPTAAGLEWYEKLKASGFFRD